ncbi:hypothetical protein QMO17_30280, partial [Klebsiella pneumoniae]|nr:hypothetical protein [Klebsiella pneumoniae]
MELQKITELIDLMSRSDLTELQLQEGGHSLRLSRGAATNNAVKVGARGTKDALEGTSTEIVSAEADADEPPPQVPLPSTCIERHIFKSTMVGTFFRARAPGDEPFID